MELINYQRSCADYETLCIFLASVSVRFGGPKGFCDCSKPSEAKMKFTVKYLV